jgi:hypothetical protein
LQLVVADRWLWAWLSRSWAGWRTAFVIVKPETVIGWHRCGFRLFWTWKSRRRIGRPAVAADLRALIRSMSGSNLLWGAPRIHGELLKLALDVSQATVAKYMRRRIRPPSQTWRTFLTSHVQQIAARRECLDHIIIGRQRPEQPGDEAVSFTEFEASLDPSRNSIVTDPTAWSRVYVML